MSSGEVWDAATTEPAVGMCVLPALPRELEWLVSIGVGNDCVVKRKNDLPSANAIDLQINPPDARDSNNAPEIRFAQDGSRGGPLDDGEPDESREEE